MELKRQLLPDLPIYWGESSWPLRMVFAASARVRVHEENWV